MCVLLCDHSPRGLLSGRDSDAKARSVFVMSHFLSLRSRKLSQVLLITYFCRGGKLQLIYFVFIFLKFCNLKQLQFDSKIDFGPFQSRFISF